MNQIEKPAWLEGWQPAPPKAKPEPKPNTGSPRWYKGMPSPNPDGRPKVVDRRAKIAERMLSDAADIVAMLTDKALEGDTGAASVILSRCIPPLRGQHERVQFAFDATAPVPQQIEAVLSAIASGAVSADVGQTIISALGTLADARATEELEKRITILEARPV